MRPAAIPMPPLILEYLQRPGMCQRLRNRIGLCYHTWRRIVATGYFPRKWRDIRCYDFIATVLEEMAGARFVREEW